MFYYLYQITNKATGKIYVGVHKTQDMDDGYMGSGKVLKSAIEKYGIENFEKVILETFATSEQMYAKEKEIVNEQFLARTDTYNLRRGGSGGFDYINTTKSTEDKFLHRSLGGRKSGPTSIRKVHEIRRQNGSYDTAKNPFKSVEFQKEMCIRAASAKSNTKRKKTFKDMGHSKGEKNSQFGSMWITNGTLNKKIQKDSSVPDGWHTGRTMNK